MNEEKHLCDDCKLWSEHYDPETNTCKHFMKKGCEWHWSWDITEEDIKRVIEK